MTLPPLTLDEVFDTSPRLPGEFDADDIWSEVPRNGVLRREFDAERIVATWQTAQHLRTMRETTPTLRTLTIVDVLYDVVMAIRERWRRE